MTEEYFVEDLVFLPDPFNPLTGELEYSSSSGELSDSEGCEPPCFCPVVYLSDPLTGKSHCEADILVPYSPTSDSEEDTSPQGDPEGEQGEVQCDREHAELDIVYWEDAWDSIPSEEELEEQQLDLQSPGGEHCPLRQELVYDFLTGDLVEECITNQLQSCALGEYSLE